MPPLKIAYLAFFIPIMGWIASLYLSDFLDRKLDRIQKPHRPIPSGRIAPKEALIIGGVFALSGLLLTVLFLNIKNILLVFIVALLVFTYSKISKSHGMLGHLNRGMVIIAAYFFGVLSINPSIHSLPTYIWLLPLAFFFHDTNTNIVGAIRDIEGDKKGGYITIPVKYGAKNSIFISLFLTIFWLSLLFYSQLNYGFLNNNFYIFMIIDLFILFLLYVFLFHSTKNYSREKALKSHEFFVIERVTLASALIAGIIEIKLALSIYLISLFVTVVSQYTLRKKYEFVIKK